MGAAGSIGRPVRRREDERILSGHTQFLDDIRLDGMLHMAFVRSPHAHARVRAVRGALWTAADLVGLAVPARVDPPPGLIVADAPHPVLAGDEVRYEGQPVAVVVGETRAEAEDALDRVEVDYEVLEPVLDPRAGEELARWEQRAGDVEGAFARAAHVVRTEHVIPRLVASPLETRGAIARREDERLTVWTSSQSAHRSRTQLWQILGLPAHVIRVIVPDVGGAFESKGTLPVETPVVALGAIELGRPVKWIEDRRENLLCAPQGRGQRASVELALDADGRILGLRGRILADLGAYLLPSTAIPPHTTAMGLSGSYDIPAVEVIVTGARTNRVPTAPYRGSGRPEATYLIETTIDAAARELGIDALELRRRNLVRSFPHRTALGWTYDSGDYESCLNLAVALSRTRRRSPGASWTAAPDAQDRRSPDSWSSPPAVERREVLTGVGVALYVARCGGLYETATVRRSGEEFVVCVGSVPSGQGHHTLFAQIAAGRLGVDASRVRVVTGDTDALADGVGSFAARTTVMGGSAVAAAVDDLLAGGPGDARFEAPQVFSSGAYVAVVEITRATGAVRVRRLVAVDDAGRIVNPMLAEGQVIGAAVQGLGAVLTEEAPASSLLDYALLTAAEIPEFSTAFVENPSPLNPLGAKGIGEAGTIGAPAAVANAVANALGGRRVDPPFTAEKVWRAMQ
ncbi:xanthine dehydrogenase family protein molybdopterin-binding subunit [Solirubrobacter soli]|uniref:xanthine dehydrogenase family protein molybdopterin-binding subunit n=1 Tax=Solirubrobacter soli TaxID=363832 RepID=UPI00040488F5|nr:xanthine dehydrogenase family protein molybdopterin-binding subunit [Solirubrobacter soli]